jgi:PPM family protein phosphatase
MIQTDQPHLPVAAQSDMGKNRKNNEDRFSVSSYIVSKRNPTPVLLAVLSDGIGGHRAGEVAAEIAVTTITQKVAESDASDPLQTLKAAIETASNEVYKQSLTDPERQGMGGTCACAWIMGDQLFITNIGDSRMFLMRGGSIQQISTDHTWIQEALDIGLITPDQVAGHPNAHVIRRYVGSPTPPEVDFRLHLAPKESDSQAIANQGMHLQKDDRLLLCSDGLTDLVAPAEILEVFQQTSNLPDTVQALVNLANERGGHDNITIIAIGVPKVMAAAIKPPTKLRYFIMGCLGLLVLAVLATIATAAFLYTTGRVKLPFLPTVKPKVTPTIQVTPTTLVQNLLPVDSSQSISPALPEPTPTLQPSSTITVTHTPNPSPTQAATFTPWPTSSFTPTATPTFRLFPPTNTPIILLPGLTKGP